MVSHLDAFYSYSLISEEFLIHFSIPPEEQCAAAKSRPDLQGNMKENNQRTGNRLCAMCVVYRCE